MKKCLIYAKLSISIALLIVALVSNAPSQQAASKGEYFDTGNGIKLYYEVRGEGPVVMLVHDGLLHSDVWDAQLQAFSARYKIIRYDRRGYGRSDLSKEGYSEVEDLHALLKHLNVTRATLIGSSAGGNLCIEYTLAYPQHVSALALVGPVVSGMSFSEHFIRRNQNNSRPLFEKKDIASTIENWSNDPYIIAPGNADVRRRMRDMLTKNPHNLTHPRLEKPSDKPALGRLAQIKVPTLLIAGEADIPDVHAHIGAIQAGIAKSKRIVMPGVGHLPYFEKPEEFNRVVLEFLAGL
jgi:pimeloyl-ACP methyl ester carboxylesterase